MPPCPCQICFTLCLFQDGVIVKGVASYHCIFIIFNIVIIITPLGLASTLYIQDGIKIIDYAIVIKSSRLSSSSAFQCTPLRLPVVNIQDEIKIIDYAILHSTLFARCLYPRWYQNHRLYNSPLHSVRPAFISKMESKS